MKQLIVVLVFLVVISCTNESNVVKKEENSISKISEVSISEDNAITLDLNKNILTLPIVDSINMDTVKEDCIFSEKDWLKMGLDKVEVYKEDASTHYHLIGKLSCQGQKLCLIGRALESENVHWLVLLNEKDEWMAHLQTAYTNAEGFLTNQAILTREEIIIKTWNDFSEEKYKEEKYRIKKDAFVKL